MKKLFFTLVLSLSAGAFAGDSLKNYQVYEAFSMAGFVPELRGSKLVHEYEVSCRMRSRFLLGVEPYVDSYKCVINGEIVLDQAVSKLLDLALTPYDEVIDRTDWDGAFYNGRFEGIKVKVSIDKDKVTSPQGCTIEFN